MLRKPRRFADMELKHVRRFMKCHPQPHIVNINPGLCRNPSNIGLHKTNCRRNPRFVKKRNIVLTQYPTTQITQPNADLPGHTYP
jgi:hypothetical protein